MPDVNIVVGYRPLLDGLTPLFAGVDLAQKTGAALYVVHVIDQFDQPINPDSADWEKRHKEAIEGQRATAQSVLDETSLKWFYRTARGRPRNLICKIGDDVDAALFVVGRDPDRGKIRAAFTHGVSLSHSLLKKTKRPVLIVPAKLGDDKSKCIFMHPKKNDTMP